LGLAVILKKPERSDWRLNDRFLAKAVALPRLDSDPFAFASLRLGMTARPAPRRPTSSPDRAPRASFRGLPERTLMERLTMTIEGMTCEHCVRAVRGRLEKTPGVKVDDVQIGSAVIEYNPATTNVDDIEEAIADEGYTAFVAD
jgi:copper chaperone